ncbi:hypothetical protein M427DRAFT_52111 [Gonapodya prolifera JEL478]|uniref:Uncharacterized protein n=1 Tax=Gonapodya prolifera (strain JEL478) TaxID=1344416 RepID=A0A139AUT9_GONPJ|nr:hypothetical protein M427DRAFT_52111 [Gonapodya prolifera JEL478]|eukprot:KXS20506.1 hypothetical protein M427DRAFT_52111 [Gonapodya prolifera JEL478]
MSSIGVHRAGPALKSAKMLRCASLGPSSRLSLATVVGSSGSSKSFSQNPQSWAGPVLASPISTKYCTNVPQTRNTPNRPASRTFTSTSSNRRKATEVEPLTPPPSTFRVPEPPPKPIIEPPPSVGESTAPPVVGGAHTDKSGSSGPKKVVLGPQKPEPDTGVRKLLHEQLKRHPKLKDSGYYQSLMKEREQLFKEAFDEGYWDDVKDILAQKNAKFSEAPNDLIPYELAPTLPVLGGRLLSGGTTDPLTVATKHKVTFVGILFSKFAEAHVDSYLKPLLARYPINTSEGIKNNPDVGLMLINVEENSAKAWIQAAFRWLMKMKTDKLMQDRYMLYPHSLSEHRRTLGLFNKYLGYAMLVDRWGKVRWMAHGPASEKELEFLVGDSTNTSNAVELLKTDVDAILTRERKGKRQK